MSQNQPRRRLELLTSWKEIATYLGKGVRTVQRWEARLGLPVIRPADSHSGIVMARPSDLEAWLVNRRQPLPRNLNGHGKSGADARATFRAYTVNEEMQHRNDLLSQLNNDLNNLLNNVDLPMVMVGADLTVRRYTPSAGTLLGLVNTDVGRPIPRLKFNLDLPWLEQVMLDVIRDAHRKQYDIQDRSDSRRYRFRFSPYKTLDNRIDGVVLSVIEIDEFHHDAGEPAAAKKTSNAKKKAAKSTRRN